MSRPGPDLWTETFYRAVNPVVKSIQFQRVPADWVFRSRKTLGYRTPLEMLSELWSP